MKTRSLVSVSMLAWLVGVPNAFATDYYASPSGSGNGTSQDSPSSLSSAASKAAPGDTVYLLDGKYSGTLSPPKSGNSSGWITFKAAPGAVPVFEGTGAQDSNGVGNGQATYIRFDGIVSRNWATGFGNGWKGAAQYTSNGNQQYVNCIADGNVSNGIAFRSAKGVLISQCIVAHNGNSGKSWSSGVDLYSVDGTYTDNIVESTLSFENIDMQQHSDGSGFIVDESCRGATFRNCIGFRNGGSCIRLTKSINTHMINNTCVGDGLDSSSPYHHEIFFSGSDCNQGALLVNNLAIPTSGQQGLQGGSGVTSQGNLWTGTPSLIVSGTAELDFHLASGASAAIDQGVAHAEAPGADIGFDWKCIKSGVPSVVLVSGYSMPSYWQYSINYDYIKTVGGVAGCFKPGARTSTPDIGAHESGSTPVNPAGGASSTGGTSSVSTGGTSSVSTGGSFTISTGGTSSVNTGGTFTISTGGKAATGGSSTVSTGGKATTGGSSTVGTGGVVSNTGGASVTNTGGASVVANAGGQSTPVGGSSTVVGAGGANPGASATTVSNTMPAATVDQGACSCRAAGTNRYGLSAAWASLGLAVMALGRRRRHSRRG